MKTKKYIPFPNGTIRGPFTCGKGNDATGGVQFCVQTKDGWVYFIGARKELNKLKRDAENWSKKVLTE